MPTKERVADMTVTTTQLAAVLGITNRRVQQLTQDGVLTTVSRGKFVLGDAVQAYNASTARGGQRPKSWTTSSRKQKLRSKPAKRKSLKLRQKSCPGRCTAVRMWPL